LLLLLYESSSVSPRHTEGGSSSPVLHLGVATVSMSFFFSIPCVFFGRIDLGTSQKQGTG